MSKAVDKARETLRQLEEARQIMIDEELDSLVPTAHKFLEARIAEAKERLRDELDMDADKSDHRWR